MRDNRMDAQETRSERQTVALTPSELNDLRLVAAFRNVEISVLIRDQLEGIWTEADRIRSIRLAPSA